MYCTQCGAQRPLDCRFCTECGAAQVPTQPQQPYPQAPHNAFTPPFPPPLHPYKQIGGMLLFIQVLRILSIIGMVFFGIIMLIMTVGLVFIVAMGDLITQTLREAGQHYYIWSELLPPVAMFGSAVMMLTSFVAGIVSIVSMGQLIRRNPKFLRVYEISVIIMLAGFLVYDFSLLAIGSPMLMQQLVSTLFAAGVCALWFLYYARSVRVRTYMGSDEYIRQSIFLRKATPPQPAVPDNPSAST